MKIVHCILFWCTLHRDHNTKHTKIFDKVAENARFPRRYLANRRCLWPYRWLCFFFHSLDHIISWHILYFFMLMLVYFRPIHFRFSFVFQNRYAVSINPFRVYSTSSAIILDARNSRKLHRWENALYSTTRNAQKYTVSHTTADDD